MYEGKTSAGEGLPAGVATGDGPVELADTGVRQLRDILSGGINALLRLPPNLERSFRRYFRSRAASLLRKSIFGLAGLYLLVVVPVGLFATVAERELWLWYGVMPIGLVLIGLLLVTRLPQLDNYIELSLGVAVFVCLTGTIYCAMLLADSYLGQVAAFETIYVLFVAFSMLRLSAQLALRGALAAFLVAMLLALYNDVQPSWLNALLYFFVPLLICAINGYMLEYAARRDFIQMLCSRGESRLLLDELQALQRRDEELPRLLHLCLGRVCSHMGWLAGRVHECAGENDLMMLACYPYSDASRGWGPVLQQQWPREQISALVRDVSEQGKPAWQTRQLTVNTVHTVTHLAFPLRVDNRLLGVAEFFSPRPETPDANLLAMMEQACQLFEQMFERNRQTEQMRKMALQDGLTGLANRSHLLSRLSKALQRHRSEGQQFALLFLDVDRFKWVNDSLGHSAGDALLAGVAARLRRALPEPVFIARVGGDEFAILLEDIGNYQQVDHRVRGIQEHLLLPIMLDDHRVEMAVTIGVAMGPGDYEQADEVLRDADTAMSYAKQERGSGVALFADDMHERVRHRFQLTTDLKGAIEASKLELYYQPIIDLASGQLTGFESLVRWRHEQHGMLMPDSFIPLAEETGLLTAMTRVLLRKATTQLASWKKELRTAASLSVSVNLGADYFALPTTPDEIITLVRQSGLTPEALRLEITESQIIENAEACINNIRRLREAGVQIYIDDFGTGYSSLSYLTRFRANALKIDRSFIQHLTEDDNDAAVVKSITSLGQTLGMSVIAEGVEHMDQLRALQELGCDAVQGYLMARPLSVEAAARLIKLHQPGEIGTVGNMFATSSSRTL